MNQYLMARLLWNTGTDMENTLDEYFHRYYPTSSDSTRQFYADLEHATENIKAFKHYVISNGKGFTLRGALLSEDGPMFPLDHLQYDTHHSTLNDGPDIVEIVEAMQNARRALDDALLTCRDAAERDRLLLAERRFAYGEAMVDFYYHLVRTALFHRRGDEALARYEFAYVERMADRLRQVKDLIQVASSHANAEDGLIASQAEKAYEFFKEKYGSAKE